MQFRDTLILMRGGGDLATGAAVRCVRAGFPLVITELPQPLVVRRTVALASAVLDGEITVEGVRAARVESVEVARELAGAGTVPVIVDPDGTSIAALTPAVVIDARMAKRNIDTAIDDAPLVIALGPGFTAGTDCDAVIETNRGHFLGRVYWEGAAEPNTGTPGIVEGYGAERVLRAPVAGTVVPFRDIGDMLEQDELVASVDDRAVRAPFPGVLRGIVAEGTKVPAGLKIGDVDPRGDREHCFTVSDKSLAIGGGVLEALLTWKNRST